MGVNTRLSLDDARVRCPDCSMNQAMLVEMLNETEHDSENRDLAKHLRANCPTCTAAIVLLPRCPECGEQRPNDGRVAADRECSMCHNTFEEVTL